MGTYHSPKKCHEADNLLKIIQIHTWQLKYLKVLNFTLQVYLLYLSAEATMGTYHSPKKCHEADNLLKGQHKCYGSLVLT